MRGDYFRDIWNIFDLVLVLIGISTLFMDFLLSSQRIDDSHDVGAEARMLRVHRIFRVLRIVRVFKLAKLSKIVLARLTKSSDALKMAELLKSITVLRAFVRAHATSQKQLLDFIGADSDIKTSEEARCIIESQTSVYLAIALAASEAKRVDAGLLVGMNMLRTNIVATQELVAFVEEAHGAGIIAAREAECIFSALQDHERIFHLRLVKAEAGQCEDDEGAVRLEKKGNKSRVCRSVQLSMKTLASRASVCRNATTSKSTPNDDKVGSESSERKSLSTKCSDKKNRFVSVLSINTDASEVVLDSCKSCAKSSDEDDVPQGESCGGDTESHASIEECGESMELTSVFRPTGVPAIDPFMKEAVKVKEYMEKSEADLRDSEKIVERRRSKEMNRDSDSGECVVTSMDSSSAQSSTYIALSSPEVDSFMKEALKLKEYITKSENSSMDGERQGSRRRSTRSQQEVELQQPRTSQPLTCEESRSRAESFNSEPEPNPASKQHSAEQQLASGGYVG